MFVLLVAALLATAQAVEFHLQNNEPGPVWVGIQGNPEHTHLSNGGLILDQGQGVVLQAEDNWAGRFWGRTWCDPATNHCQTGDCGNKIECAGAGGTPPASLAEITLKGWGDLDYYDISLVDGFNMRIAVSGFVVNFDSSLTFVSDSSNPLMETEMVANTVANVVNALLISTTTALVN
uniref:Thaumatin-like protein 2 n=1 Tax=Dendroides canadensis TaxID=55100 RepID=Q4F6N5_9CUCU|nr:thaumatin-like protein 2 [Dendroides canadensis]